MENGVRSSLQIIHDYLKDVCVCVCVCVFPNVDHKWLSVFFIWTSGVQNWINHNPWFITQSHFGKLFVWVFNLVIFILLFGHTTRHAGS